MAEPLPDDPPLVVEPELFYAIRSGPPAMPLQPPQPPRPTTPTTPPRVASACASVSLSVSASAPTPPPAHAAVLDASASSDEDSDKAETPSQTSATTAARASSRDGPRTARQKRRQRERQRRRRRRCIEPQDCDSATALFGGLSAGAVLNVVAFVPLCVCMQELDRNTRLFYAGGVVIGSMVVFAIVLAYLFMNS